MSSQISDTISPRNDEKQVRPDSFGRGAGNLDLGQGSAAEEAVSETPIPWEGTCDATMVSNTGEDSYDLPGSRSEYRIEVTATGGLTIEHLTSGEQVLVSDVDYLRFSDLQIHRDFLTRTNPG